MTIFFVMLTTEFSLKETQGDQRPRNELKVLFRLFDKGGPLTHKASSNPFETQHNKAEPLYQSRFEGHGEQSFGKTNKCIRVRPTNVLKTNKCTITSCTFASPVDKGFTANKCTVTCTFALPVEKRLKVNKCIITYTFALPVDKRFKGQQMYYKLYICVSLFR